MKETTIYQTLEDRSNDEEVLAHGPYWCHLHDVNGKKKEGAREPWLGPGYYFWDTRIADARWWGETIYQEKGYIICQLRYDAHSPSLFDMVGDLAHYDEFMSLARQIQERRRTKTISFPIVLAYLKRHAGFSYKAIRVCPHPPKFISTNITFPGSRITVARLDKVQLCFFDKSLFIEPFEIVERSAGLSIQFEYSSKQK